MASRPGSSSRSSLTALAISARCAIPTPRMVAPAHRRQLADQRQVGEIRRVFRAYGMPPRKACVGNRPRYALAPTHMNRRLLTAAGAWLAVLTVTAAAAAPPAAAAAPTATEIDFLYLLHRGGMMIYPLALLSVIGVVLVLLYLLTIRRNAVVSDRFMNMAESLLRKRDYLGLIDYSHRQNECIARITQKTLDFVLNNPGIPFENVREVAQTEGSRQAGLLTSRVTYLADIGSIAPMIGLLGTVIGMIKAFIEIAAGRVPGVREMGLAQGVSEALIATAFGLAISILAMSFYSFFRGRVQKIIAELEAAATHLVALLHTQFERQAVQSPMRAGVRGRDDYPLTTASPLVTDRPDLHGI